jgi:hypothetical protein
MRRRTGVKNKPVAFFACHAATLRDAFRGNRKPETGNRKPETGNRKPETGNRKPETERFSTR